MARLEWSIAWAARGWYRAAANGQEDLLFRETEQSIRAALPMAPDSMNVRPGASRANGLVGAARGTQPRANSVRESETLALRSPPELPRANVQTALPERLPGDLPKRAQGGIKDPLITNSGAAVATGKWASTARILRPANVQPPGPRAVAEY